MNKKAFLVFHLTLALNAFMNNGTSIAQISDLELTGNKKPDKETEQALSFARMDSLVNSRQFVFLAEFNEGSDMVFVLVDSLFGEVQNGNRNNLQARITEFEVKTNEKRKNLSVTIHMRWEIYIADAFLFIDAYGSGKAAVKSDFPGNFTFFGNVSDLEHALIYEGPSHFVH
jgi:hypothetical protein